jgi:biotin-dependent carboxylase-like uncharacterized protein
VTGRRIEVIAPGPLSTIQDHGRHGVQHLGFSPTGAVDTYALAAGNLLLGNEPAAAAIEMTLGDALFRLHGHHLFVVVGAEADIDLDGRPLPPWCVHEGTDAAILRIGRARAGVRVYLCIAGGIAVPLAYGSRSTDLVAGIGGHEGRALRAGDILPMGPTRPEARRGRRLALVARPLQRGVRVVRAVPGPQRRAFTQQSERTLYGSLYRVSPRADRTGLYLDGPRLSHVGRPDILSEGVTAGSIQVPGDGQPLVLLAEHRSVGGYAKIATVCAADLARLGQARPGDRIVLVQSDHAAAQTAYRASRYMCRHSVVTPAAASISAPLSFEEWVSAVDMVIDQVITDERLPLLRSDLYALQACIAATNHGRGTPTYPPELQIQTVMPDVAFPVARAYARATGTLLAVHPHAVSIPCGGTLVALWSPGILTPLIAMHPLESYRLRHDMGARVREGDLLLEGVFVDALPIIDGVGLL